MLTESVPEMLRPKSKDLGPAILRCCMTLGVLGMMQLYANHPLQGIA